MSKHFFERYSGVEERIKLVDNVATVLTPEEATVLVKATSATFNLTLPPVSVMKGKIITVHMISRDGTDYCTILAVGAHGWSNQTLNANGERYLFYSDGIGYFIVDNAT